MAERLHTIWAQFNIFFIAGIMSLGALIFCWFIWRHERRKRIKVAIAKYFEAIAVVIVGPLDEEYLTEWLTLQSTDNIWR